jgi:hypothetical protein
MAGWAADSGGAIGGPSGAATSRFVAVRAPRAGGAAAVHALPDTVLRRALDLPARSVRLGLGATAEEPHVTLGLKRVPVGATGAFGPRAAPLPGPTPAFAPRSEFGPPLVVEALPDIWLQRRVASLGGAPAEGFLPAAPIRRVTPAGQDPDRFVTPYADLALRVRSRMELGGDWTRFEPCDALFGAGCNPTLLPQLSPEVQFGVQVAGTILDRVRVDVDFDQSREFDAAIRRSGSFTSRNRCRRGWIRPSTPMAGRSRARTSSPASCPASIRARRSLSSLSPSA